MDERQVIAVGRAVPDGLHGRIAELVQAGLSQQEIAGDVGRHRTTVSHHINGHCTCRGPRYVYVRVSSLPCRRCGGFCLACEDACEQGAAG